MALLSRLALVAWQIGRASLQQVLQQLPTVLEERFAKAQLHRLQVANPSPFPLLTDQIEEGLSFRQPFLGDLRRLEFFFA